MNIEKLKVELSKLGYIQILKAGSVFTLLITGENLDNGNIFSTIHEAIDKYTDRQYPFIEALKNDSNFFCIVLKTP